MSAPAWLDRRASWLAAAVVVLGAAMRLAALGTAPPGMHPDAASNAWNTRCLLATGHDWSGTAWPILTSRGFGQGQSTLYYYLLMPFQAVGGLTPAATDLPSAVTGTLSILLLYLAGARLFGKPAGLLAGAVAAVAPWHVYLSRWGHESGIVPFLTAAPLAVLVAARLPFSERDPARARPWLALAAGLAIGVACYGYLAMRVFWPVALTAAAVVNGGAVLAFARDRRGRRALGALALGLVATLGPLAWRHLTDPTIGKRAREFTSWSEGDPFATKIAKVAARYPGTMSPDFLFVHGDRFKIHAVPGSAPLNRYVAPLLVLGLIAAAASFRTSAATRTLLAMLLAYPVADALARNDGPHLLRGAPGIVPLALLAGVGGVAAWTWLNERRRGLGTAAAGLFTVWAIASTARFGVELYGAYARRVDTWQLFNADLLEAIRWVKPRLADADALYVSMSVSSAMDQPFVLALDALDYDPKRWFADPKEILKREDTDVVRSFGKVHFLFDAHDTESLRAIQTNDRRERVLIIARPGEWKRGEPVHTVFLPDGRPSFVIYDLTL